MISDDSSLNASSNTGYHSHSNGSWRNTPEMFLCTERPEETDCSVPRAFPHWLSSLWRKGPRYLVIAKLTLPIQRFVYCDHRYRSYVHVRVPSRSLFTIYRDVWDTRVVNIENESDRFNDSLQIFRLCYRKCKTKSSIFQSVTVNCRFFHGIHYNKGKLPSYIALKCLCYMLCVTLVLCSSTRKQQRACKRPCRFWLDYCRFWDTCTTQKN